MSLKRNSKTGLELARDEALVRLSELEPDDDEYGATMAHVETLSNLMSQEAPEKLSPNTLVIVGGNLGIAGLLIWFERENVITTKLPAFLSKLR